MSQKVYPERPFEFRLSKCSVFQACYSSSKRGPQKLGEDRKFHEENSSIEILPPVPDMPMENSMPRSRLFVI